MRLDDAPESENVEDRRGMGGKLAVGGGIGGILLFVLRLIFGVDVNKFMGPGGPPPQQQGGEPPKDGYKQFAGKIMGMTEEVWKEEFKKNGYGEYEKPKMVLFEHAVDTGCGHAPSEVGPF